MSDETYNSRASALSRAFREARHEIDESFFVDDDVERKLSAVVARTYVRMVQSADDDVNALVAEVARESVVRLRALLAP